MKFHLLVSEKMKPVPDNVNVIQNFGEINLFSDNYLMYHSGDHMVVEGSEDAIRSWLMPFDGVWVGSGPPQLQMFHVMHVT